MTAVVVLLVLLLPVRSVVAAASVEESGEETSLCNLREAVVCCLKTTDSEMDKPELAERLN